MTRWPLMTAPVLLAFALWQPVAERDRRFHQRFDEIDTDHDGKIDPAERAAWREKQRAYYRRLRAERTAAQHH